MHPNQYRFRDHFKINTWEYVSKLKVKELDLIEVDLYFNLPYGYMSNMKTHSKHKYKYVTSFDKNIFRSLEIWVDLTWELLDRIQTIVYQLEEAETVWTFSKYLHYVGVSTYDRKFYEYYKKNIFFRNIFDVKSCLSFDYELMRIDKSYIVDVIDAFEAFCGIEEFCEEV